MARIWPMRALPGAQAENWGREVEARHDDLERAVSALQQNSDGDNRSLASQIQALTAVVNAIPVQLSDNARSGGFALSGSMATYASVSMMVPAGKTFASILCVGTGAALDATSGGLTTAYGRCVIDGEAGGESPAAKDHGSSAVNNVITATYSRNFTVTPGASISCLFQMYGLNGSAYPSRPSNFAQLAVIASFR